jgi:hypothetical protein
LAFEEDVSIDGEANARVGLDSTEALGATGRGVIDILARDDSVIRTDTEGEVGESG